MKELHKKPPVELCSLVSYCEKSYVTTTSFGVLVKNSKAMKIRPRTYGPVAQPGPERHADNVEIASSNLVGPIGFENSLKFENSLNVELRIARSL